MTKDDDAEIILRRPMKLRIYFGCMAALLFWLMCDIVRRSLPDLADPFGIYTIIGAVCFFGVITTCMLHGAGPREMRFHVRKGRYSLTQGILPLIWTKHGSTSGGEFYVLQAKSGASHVLFRASNWRFGLPLVSFDTDAKARDEAWRLGNALGVRVRRKDEVAATIVASSRNRKQR